MEPIPGSAQVSSRSARVDESKLNHMIATGPSWCETPRWGGRGRPGTIASDRGVHAKRRGLVLLPNGATVGGGMEGRASKNVPIVALADCATGDWLLAGYRSGQLFAFQLENRRGKIHVPRTSSMPHVNWKLRAPHMRSLSWLATGMIGLKKRGVVISHAELAELVGLRPRQMGTVMRQLCDWGLVRSTPVFVAKGCVTSQRANCYRLTILAMHVFRLRMPAACGTLPMPEFRIQPPRPIAAKPVPAIAPSPTVSGVVEPLPAIRQQLPANPDNSLRSYSSGEHGAYQGAVSATPTIDFRTAVAYGSVCLSGLEGVKARPAALSAGSSEPEKPDTARRSPLLVHRDEERVLQRQREQRDLVEQRIAERERARRTNRPVVVPDDDDDGPRGGLDPRTLDELRRYRESLDDERRDRQRYLLLKSTPTEPAPPPAPRRLSDDEDLANVIETAWKTRFGEPTVVAQVVIGKLRDRGKNGGDS